MDDNERNDEILSRISHLSENVDRLSQKLDDYMETASARSPAYSVVHGLPSPETQSQFTDSLYGGSVRSGNRSLGRKSVNFSYDAPAVMGEEASPGKRPAMSALETQDFSRDENEERGNWSGRLDFLLSCLGYAVGLGNVWRFPYKCYKNGGGAFFIPYAVMLIFVGMPIFFLELSLGQYTSAGPLTCWKFAPIFTGLGYGMVIVSSLVCIYYNMIIAWSLFYLFGSFTSDLKWQHCTNWWNTDYCYKKIPDVNCSGAISGLFRAENGTCYNVTTGNATLIGLWNVTTAEDAGIIRKSATEEYYNNYVLRRSDGVHEMGDIQWQLALCLLLAWFIVFLCLCKGIKSSGKVVYFTALFPYVVLVILLIRGLTLKGFKEGIYYYITPQWHRLADAQVWNDAANQIFFSLSTCWGGLITLSSYNRFHNNCFRDTLIVTLGNCLTSVFAGFVIFSFLGFMAEELQTTVDKVATAGTGLAFIVYPDAVSRMPVSPLWAILFFVMLITLGLDSQFTLLETVTTALMDRWPALFVRKRKTGVILTICATFYLIGLIMCTNGGSYVLELLDSYAGGWAVLMIGIGECFSLLWVYGWKEFSGDIALMLGKRPWLWWRLTWTAFTPMVILFVLLFSWVDYKPATLGEYVFPLYANAIGWVITVAIVLPIPTLAIIMFCTADGSFLQRMRTITSPARDWGPALVKHRRLVTHLPGFVMDPTKEKRTLSSFPGKGSDNLAYQGERL